MTALTQLTLMQHAPNGWRPRSNVRLRSNLRALSQLSGLEVGAVTKSRGSAVGLLTA